MYNPRPFHAVPHPVLQTFLDMHPACGTSRRTTKCVRSAIRAQWPRLDRRWHIPRWGPRRCNWRHPVRPWLFRRRTTCTSSSSIIITGSISISITVAAAATTTPKVLRMRKRNDSKLFAGELWGYFTLKGGLGRTGSGELFASVDCLFWCRNVGLGRRGCGGEMFWDARLEFGRMVLLSSHWLKTSLKFGYQERTHWHSAVQNIVAGKHKLS